MPSGRVDEEFNAPERRYLADFEQIESFFVNSSGSRAAVSSNSGPISSSSPFCGEQMERIAGEGNQAIIRHAGQFA